MKTQVYFNSIADLTQIMGLRGFNPRNLRNPSLSAIISNYPGWE